MKTETIADPSQVTTEETPAPEVKAKTQEQSVSPPAEEVKTDDAQAGQEKAESKSDEPEELTEGQKRRKERAKERWQILKSSTERINRLEAELSLYRPKQIDYSQIIDPDEVIAERTAAKVLERQSAAKESELSTAKQDQARATQEAIGQFLQDGQERMPDFNQVFTSTVPVHEQALPHILESDKGVEIAYYLGKNIAEARNLNHLFATAPTRALIELGRIEARLSAPPARTVSAAPKPAQTIGGGGASPIAKSPDQMSQKEYESWRSGA